MSVQSPSSPLVLNVAEWLDMRSLLVSLQSSDVRTCLITDVTAAEVGMMMNSSVAFDDVIAAPSQAAVRLRFSELLTTFSGDELATTTLVTRLARLVAFATPPYDVTLFLDDDAYVCSHKGLSLSKSLIRVMTGSADVRLVDRRLSQGELEEDEDYDLAVCLLTPGCQARPTTTCGGGFLRSAPFDLQGGSILVRRSVGARRWAHSLLAAYEQHWAGVNNTIKKVGRDQPAHAATAKKLCGPGIVGVLPANFNFKLSLKCRSRSVPFKPCSSIIRHTVRHVVQGPVVLLHYKDGKKEAPALCALLNKDIGLRTIYNATKCIFKWRGRITPNIMTVTSHNDSSRNLHSTTDQIRQPAMDEPAPGQGYPPAAGSRQT